MAKKKDTADGSFSASREKGKTPTDFPGLPDAVAKEFICTIPPTTLITKAPDRVTVNLKNITLDQARAMTKKGILPYLKPRPTGDQEKATKENLDKPEEAPE